MKTIRNLSIKTKLLTGFMCIVLLIAITGLFGTFGITNIQENAQEIYSSNLQSIDELHSIKENLLDEISLVQNAMLDNDADKIKEAIKIIDETQSTNSTYIESYSKRPMSNDAKKIIY